MNTAKVIASRTINLWHLSISDIKAHISRKLSTGRKKTAVQTCLFWSAVLAAEFACASINTARGTEILASKMFEATFTSKKAYQDPFNDVELDVIFTREGTSWRVPAYWRGENRWSVRFTPPVPGIYKYRLQSTDSSNPDLNGHERSVRIAQYSGSNALLKRGAFRVSRNGRFFEYADGTPFYWLGDTWYSGFSDRLPWAGFKAMTDDREAKGFTVVQIAVMTVSNEEEAPADPGFCNEGGCIWDADFERLNPKYFDFADRRVRYLIDAQIAPAIFGMWHQALSQMGLEKGKQLWRYIIARYGAYPVFWVAGGEIRDAGDPYSEAGWTELIQYIRKIDPYHHPLTVHEPPPPYDKGHTDELLKDFDMTQPSHFGWPSIAAQIAQLNVRYARTTGVKPLVVGEVGWETLGAAHYEDFQRTAFWLAMLNGAAGFSYGNAITGESYSADKPLHRTKLSLLTWDEAMHFPSTRQLGFSARLLQRYPWQRFAPHPEWVIPRGTTLLEPHAESSGFSIDLMGVLFEQIGQQDFREFCTGCPRGVWKENNGTFQLPYAAGIPNEARVIYIPSRGGYDGGSTPPPTILKLEIGVRYRAYYFDPSLGVKFDLGQVERPAPGASIHQDDFDIKDAWIDRVGTAGLCEGKLLATGTMLATLKDVSETNAVIAVDIHTDADAALVLRYQDSDNYITAAYSAKDKRIFIRERRDGREGPQLGLNDASMLAPQARLSAEVRGGTAIVSISAGTTTVTSPIVDVKSVAAGGMGLMHGDGRAPQSFDNFMLRKSPILIEDDGLQKKLYDAQGKYRGEIGGAGWNDYAKEKHILLDAYRPERLPFPQDWILILATQNNDVS